MCGGGWRGLGVGGGGWGSVNMFFFGFFLGGGIFMGILANICLVFMLLFVILP